MKKLITSVVVLLLGLSYCGYGQIRANALRMEERIMTLSQFGANPEGE